MQIKWQWEEGNPFPFYQSMRNTNPVIKDSKQCWNVFKYEDVKQVLSNSECFSSKVSYDSMSILLMDQPQHQKYRSLFSKAFTPQAAAKLSDGIVMTAKELIHTCIKQGYSDVVRHIAIPLPVEVITELLGIPKEDRYKYIEWAEFDFVHNSALEGKSETQAAQLAGEIAMKRYEIQIDLKNNLSKLIVSRRREPKEDLISSLIKVQESSEFLTNQDVEDFCLLILVGGIETTANLISNTIAILGQSQDLFARLRANPDDVPKAIEEVFRYRSPVQSTYRIAAKDVELNGQFIRKGEPIIVWMGSANHDEQVFENANEFNMDRKNNQQHLALSYGSHFCMGSHLARLEVKTLITELLSSCEGIQIVSNAELKPIHSQVSFGYESLPMTFTPAN
jgi:cytochrome P450